MAAPTGRRTVVRVKTLLAAAVLASVMASPASAHPAKFTTPHGPDRRPCVSKAEWNSAGAATGRETRRYLEARWEVVDQGVRIGTIVGPALAYKRCGAKFPDKYYAVAYRDGDAKIFLWSPENDDDF